MRTRVAEIRETGRNAAGVRLIKIDEGDRLVAMAKIDAEEKAVDGGENAEPAAAESTGDASAGEATPPTADGTDPTGAPDADPEPDA